MRTERSYYAKFDDGHDCHFVNFVSAGRKGSAENTDDAKSAARRQFGSGARYWKLLRIERGTIQ